MEILDSVQMGINHDIEPRIMPSDEGDGTLVYVLQLLRKKSGRVYAS